LSASYAPFTQVYQDNTTSASWASSSLSASYAPFTQVYQANTTSASWASSSLSSSYALSASYAPFTQVYQDNTTSASWSSSSLSSSYARPKNSVLSGSCAAIFQSDGTLYDSFRVLITGSFTLANPTASHDGQRLVWEIIQDSVGGRNITLGNKFSTGSAFGTFALSGTPNKRDFMTAQYNVTTDVWYVLGFMGSY
jgi:hypothetical protein